MKGLHPVKYAAIGPIAVHYPAKAETNEQLKAERDKSITQKVFGL
jgi:hypothetical protein